MQGSLYKLHALILCMHPSLNIPMHLSLRGSHYVASQITMQTEEANFRRSILCKVNMLNSRRREIKQT